MVLAIDPGPTQSAYVLWGNSSNSIQKFDLVPNIDMYAVIRGCDSKTRLVTEMIACYGMAVGASVFETCTWIGRYEREAEMNFMHTSRITRMQCKMFLCHSPKAKDTNIHQALVDMLGDVGTKKNQGPLYGVRKDIWAALAVAVSFSGLYPKLLSQEEQCQLPLSENSAAI